MHGYYVVFSELLHSSCFAAPPAVEHMRLQALANNMPACAQGILGETYTRALAGEAAVSDPGHPLHLPDDYSFHRKGHEEQYEVGAYFGLRSPGPLEAAQQQQRSQAINEWSRTAGHATSRRALAFPLVAAGRVPWIDNTILARAQVQLRASASRRALLA